MKDASTMRGWKISVKDPGRKLKSSGGRRSSPHALRPGERATTREGKRGEGCRRRARGVSERAQSLAVKLREREHGAGVVSAAGYLSMPWSTLARRSPHAKEQR